MAVIHVLSKETIDQIAAGEVVERPASVVKELLENAVDAGANVITIEIKEGGITFIRVTDNGCGIDKSELQKVFLRHATSKIVSAEDLSHIVSLGFRGEAISSIAAVSRMELITKTANELTACRCIVEGGTEKECEEIGAPDGTTVLVRNLFFNTPVRKKFLKQPQTEGSYVSELMEHMAMSNPHISFKYVNNGQTRFHTSGNGDLSEIIYRIFGKEIKEALLPIDTEEGGLRIRGYIGKPEINRSNRNFETFFVNGRYIKSDIISKAIEGGYKKYMMQHKFPFVVLHFDVDTADIDVNVHPTKMEVRFTNPAALFEFTAREIETCLRHPELIPEVTIGRPDEPVKIEIQEEKKEQQRLEKQVPEPFEYKRRKQDGILVREELPYQAADTAKREEEEPFFEEMKDILQKQPENTKNMTIERTLQAQNEEKHASFGETDSPILVEKERQMELFEERLLTKEAKEEYRILGQLFDTYWLIALKDKLYIVDQHAAHEKVKYEAFMDTANNKTIASQLLQPPVIMTLSSREEQVLTEQKEIFTNLGFEIEAFGGNEYAIRSVPTELYGIGGQGLFQEMLDELSEGTLKGSAEAVGRRIATMACKAAVKGNSRLSQPEMEALFDQLLLLEDPYHCPHGRPTIISMTKYEIEKKFKRII